MFHFFKSPSLPSTSWSSPSPLNRHPQAKTLAFLVFGLCLFGIGEGLLIIAHEGATPWSILALGLSNHTGLSVGTITFNISCFMLLLWVPLQQTPGIGTIANSLIIASVLDATLNIPELVTPTLWASRLALSAIGTFCIGFGSAAYIMCNLGAGPRDGVVLGIARLFGLPLGYVRTTVELGVLAIGITLGGTFGIGTLIFALGVGIVWVAMAQVLAFLAP